MSDLNRLKYEIQNIRPSNSHYLNKNHPYSNNYDPYNNSVNYKKFISMEQSYPSSNRNNCSNNNYDNNDESMNSNKFFVENLLKQNLKAKNNINSINSTKAISSREINRPFKNMMNNNNNYYNKPNHNMNNNFNYNDMDGETNSNMNNNNFVNQNYSQSQKVLNKKDFSLNLDKFKINTANSSMKLNNSENSSNLIFNPDSRNKNTNNFGGVSLTNENLNEIHYCNSNYINTSVLLSLENAKDNQNLNFQKKIRNSSFFDNKPKHEKESRRMCVEMVKALKTLNNSNSVEQICQENNLSDLIFNQEYADAAKTKRMKILEQIYFNNSNKNKSISMAFFHSFMNDMDEKKSENISLLNFLIVPRKLKLKGKFGEPIEVYFILVPRTSIYKLGFENYAFQFYDSNCSILGAVDVLKINSCSSVQKNEKAFEMESFDGNKTRHYELECDDPYIAQHYIKSITFLSQLIKCKVFTKGK